MQGQIFRPVKTSLRALVHCWTSNNPGKNLTKFSMISDVARPAFEAALSRPETIRKGFQVTGIFPFNPSAANRDKLKAGSIIQSSSTSTSTQSKTVVADPIPLDDSDDLRQDLVYHDNQTSRGHIVHHVPHGLGLTLPPPGGQSTTETAELLAEIVNSPILDIPPPNLFLLASAPSNSPADTEIEVSQEADSSDVQNDGAPPTVRPAEDKPPHTLSRPRPWRKGSRSYRGLNLSCQHRYRLRSLREISKLE